MKVSKSSLNRIGTAVVFLVGMYIGFHVNVDLVSAKPLWQVVASAIAMLIVTNLTIYGLGLGFQICLYVSPWLQGKLFKYFKFEGINA